MMAEPAGTMLHGIRLDICEIKQNLTTMIAGAVAIGGAISFWSFLPATRYDERMLLVCLSVFLAGALSYYLRWRAPLLARVTLLLGPTLSLSLALRLVSDVSVPFFAILIVIANGAISPRLGLAAALLNTGSLYHLASSCPTFLPALVLLWLAAGAVWIQSREMYTVLGWAWASQQRAAQLLDDLRDRQGELNRTVAHMTEANRRLQRMGYELAVARLRSDEARQLKQQFAANISHELRTPLNLILGFTEMMYFRPTVYGAMEWPPALRQDVHRLYQSSRQLLDLVNDVLDLSRMDASQMPLLKERADLGLVIHEAIGLMGDLLRGRNLELRAQIPEALPSFNFDRARVRQILLNLLNNAANFTEHGFITVTVEVSDREVVVGVADTGPGIPEQELTRVFEEFYQVDMSLRRPQHGAGLGLAICKRLVELHGGRIWVESQQGVGSVFRFSLPLVREAELRHPVHSRAMHPDAKLYEPTVVFVESDADVVALLSRHLPKYRFLQAEDERHALALMEREHPRAILVNVAPDCLNVQGAFQSLADATPPEVPVLCCSIPSRSWLETATNVRRCLAKPLHYQELADCLREIGGVRDVLVVDDDRGFVQLVSRYLAGAGQDYAVRRAYGGAQALAEIRAQRPDLLLLDLIMPDVDGFSLLEMVRAEDLLPSTPIILLTAVDYSQDLLRRRGSVLGVVRRKAFSTTEAISYLQALLELSEAVYPDNSSPMPATTDNG